MDLMDLRDFQRELREIPLIHDLPEDVRDGVCAVLTNISKGSILSAGDVLYREGDRGTNTGALLMKGAVDIKSGDGQPIHRRAPELFGEMRQIDKDNQRTATVTIAEESVVFEFSWHGFVVMALHKLTKSQQKVVKDAIAAYAGERFKEIAGNAESERNAYIQRMIAMPVIQACPEIIRNTLVSMLLDVSELHSISEGEVLYVKGHQDENSGAILIEGTVNVDLGKGTLKECTAPELLGEMMQFSEDGIRTSNVSAADDSLLLSFNWHDFVERISETFGAEEQRAIRNAVKQYADVRAFEQAAQ